MQFGKQIATMATATALLALSAGAALAFPAHATGNVNVRTGPGISYNKVDALRSGENVDVKQCQSGWCYVEHSGPDGWVSANYLSQNAASVPNQNTYPGPNQDPNFGFSFGFGSNGSNFGFSIGNPPPGRGTWQQQPQSKACFYSGNNFTGQSFCMNEGTQRAAFGPIWNDKISSVRVFGNASVTLCQNYSFGGFCRTTNHNEPALGPWLNDKVSSLRVF